MKKMIFTYTLVLFGFLVLVSCDLQEEISVRNVTLEYFLYYNTESPCTNYFLFTYRITNRDKLPLTDFSFYFLIETDKRSILMGCSGIYLPPESYVIDPVDCGIYLLNCEHFKKIRFVMIRNGEEEIKIKIIPHDFFF